VQAAHGVRRSRTYLGERYRRLKKRRGSKRAALAIGHDILVIYYQMMKTGQDYQEKGASARKWGWYCSRKMRAVKALRLLTSTFSKIALR
jgi:hypothetical protein